MSLKKTPTRKKTSKIIDKNNKESNNKIVYGILLAFMFVIMISVFTNGLGIIGYYSKSIIFTLLGLGAYFFPIFISMHALLLILDRKELIDWKKAIFLYVSLFFILAVIYTSYNFSQDFNSQLKNSLELAKNFTGPGVLGTAFGYFVLKLIGKLGIYILTVLFVFISCLSLSNTSYKSFFMYSYELIKKLGFSLKSLISKISNKTKIREEDKPSIKPLHKENPKLSIDDKRDYNDLKIVGLNPRNNIDDEKIRDKKIEQKQLSVEDFDIKVENVEINYNYPPVQLLKDKEVKEDQGYVEEAKRNAQIIEDTLKSFKIDCKIVQVNRGPAVTCYELQPAGGVKLSSIVNLQDNLALNLATQGIRIEAPIPGKAVVGIEVPNKLKEFVSLKEIIDSEAFRNSKSLMPLALGKDIYGSIVVSGMEKMPHLLIAGATGSGKSVCINSIISSILFKSSPEDVKLILIDPKMVELNVYNGIPHLVIPVVTDPKKASAALNWAVREMDRRYQVFSDNYVRDINSYKEKFKNDSSMEKMPFICIIIDELSDLMMVASQEVESHICRLAQLARACGIHLIVATQRPSVDVITGLIKANIPSRISFSVSSQIDSRTILDMSGAENLLGNGDMLFFPSNIMKPKRVQGAFISEKEVENLVSFIKNNSEVSYDKTVIKEIEENRPKLQNSSADYDEHLMEAIDMVIQDGQASVSLIQRKLRVGYARAGRIIDEMESLGIVGPHEGSKPRKILVNRNILREEESGEYSQQVDDV